MRAPVPVRPMQSIGPPGATAWNPPAREAAEEAAEERMNHPDSSCGAAAEEEEAGETPHAVAFRNRQAKVEVAAAC